MVDNVPKITPELFTLGGVEQIKRVRPKPEDHNEQGSDAEDEGLQAHLDRLADIGKERDKGKDKGKDKDKGKEKSLAKSKGVVSKSVGDEGEVDDDVKHVDLII